MFGLFSNFSNGDWINAILAFITAIYVFLTYQILVANRKLLNESINTRAAAERPRIAADIVVRNRVITMLQISNTGKNAATNVRLKLDRDFYQFSRFDESINIRNVPLFNEPISSIQPGAKISFYLSQGFNLNKIVEDRLVTPLQFEIDASYEFGSEHFSEKIKIDLTAYRSSGGNLPEDVEQLEKIEKAILKLCDRLEQVTNLIDQNNNKTE